MKNRQHRRKSHVSKVNVFCIILTVVLLAILGIFRYIDQLEQQKESAYYAQLNQQLDEQRRAEKAARQELFNNSSFYQKLTHGFDVNILVVGDSIGAGAGASDGNHSFAGLLKSELKQTYLKEAYSARVRLTNVSMGGNASYAGYTRVMALEDDIEYDLAIICYGQNDGETNFSMYYETIIRAIASKYPKCSIISILESSQRAYTAKMQTIQKICKYYSIPVADTIAPFRNSYDELVTDGVHPNDAGYAKYAEVLSAVIGEQVKANTGLPNYSITPINSGVENFVNCRYIAKSEFERVENTYTIETAASGIFGIDYTYLSGNNRAEIYVDGELLAERAVTFNYDFSQRHISIVSESCTAEKVIKIKFATKEQADGFRGLVFSWE